MRRCETRILRAGSCRHPEAATRIGAGLKPAVFPALVGLILHPEEGPVLFDTGYDPAFFRATEPFPERLYRWATPVELAPGESLVEQLARLSISPHDVRRIVLSHFHGDHVAGLHAFPGARVFCARAGLDDLNRRGRVSAVRHGLLRELVPQDIGSRADFFEDRPRAPLPSALAPFEEGADLLGDGSLLAVDLPGHCPGHWGLVVRTEADALHFLVADAAWSSRAIRENAPPPALTTAVLGATLPYRRTLSDLHALHRRNPEVVLTPSHCLERAQALERDGA